MNAIHVMTNGVASPNEAARIESTVAMLGGVSAVLAVPSLGIVSVLYDDSRTGPGGKRRREYQHSQSDNGQNSGAASGGFPGCPIHLAKGFINHAAHGFTEHGARLGRQRRNTLG